MPCNARWIFAIITLRRCASCPSSRTYIVFQFSNTLLSTTIFTSNIHYLHTIIGYWSAEIHILDKLDRSLITQHNEWPCSENATPRIKLMKLKSFKYTFISAAYQSIVIIHSICAVCVQLSCIHIIYSNKSVLYFIHTIHCIQHYKNKNTAREREREKQQVHVYGIRTIFPDKRRLLLYNIISYCSIPIIIITKYHCWLAICLLLWENQIQYDNPDMAKMAQ